MENAWGLCSDQKELKGGKGLFGSHFRAIVHQGRTSARNLKQKLWRNVLAGSLTSSFLAGFLRSSSTSFLGNDTTHGDLGPPTSTSHQDNLPSACPQADVIRAIPQRRVPSQMILSYVKLTKLNRSGSKDRLAKQEGLIKTMLGSLSHLENIDMKNSH